MYSVIIPMAGSGKRAKVSKNKALLELNGKPMFMYSYELFKSYGFEIILVCKEHEINIVRSYVDSNTKIVLGSDTRAKSVYNGIKVATSEYVFIHDAARPFLNRKIVDELLETIKNNDAAFVAITPKDTIRNINNNVLNRETLLMAQTPQVMKKDDILYAYNKVFLDNVEITDDIQALELYTNIKAKVVYGDDMNFKVTTPYDVKIASYLAKENFK